MISKEVQKLIEQRAEEYAHSQDPDTKKFRFPVTDMEKARSTYTAGATEFYERGLKEKIERYEWAITELKKERNMYHEQSKISKCWIITNDLKIEKILNGELEKIQ